MTELDTTVVPATDRVAYWQRALTDFLVPVEVGGAGSGDLRARAETARLGAVRLATVTSGPYELMRTAALIRQSDPESYLVTLMLGGTGGVSQGQRTTGLGVGDLAIYDTSRPFRVWTEAAATPARSIIMMFPRTLLSLPRGEIATATRFGGPRGVGRLLVEFAARVTREVEWQTPATRAQLSVVLVDLLAATLACRPPAAPAAPVPTLMAGLASGAAGAVAGPAATMVGAAVGARVATRAAAPAPVTAGGRLAAFAGSRATAPIGSSPSSRMARIDTFIWQNLADPLLSPSAIASAHHISLRYLHRIFRAEHGVTVAAWIRQARLQRCRRDLADPVFATWPVERIARRWGFGDLATFSRTFKQWQGLPPSAYREVARGHVRPATAAS